MPSVYIKTYGCQLNERDSEAVAAQLVAKPRAVVAQYDLPAVFPERELSQLAAARQTHALRIEDNPCSKPN